MREVCITVEAPPDVSVRVVRKEAPSRLRLSPRGRIGKPVTAFRTAFASSSLDGGATAPADAVRDAFECLYQTSGKNPREAVDKAWRRALAFVEDAFTLENSSGAEILVKLPAAPLPRPPTPSGHGNATATGPSISATRGVRAPRSG